MTYKEKVQELREKDSNCCQAVFCCCCDKFPISEELAWQIGAFFGGGMRRHEVCGAVTGALMGLGLKYGVEKNRECNRSKEFMDMFEKEFGSIFCRDLIKVEGKKERELCPDYMFYAAKFLEDEFK